MKLWFQKQKLKGTTSRSLPFHHSSRQGSNLERQGEGRRWGSSQTQGTAPSQWGSGCGEGVGVSGRSRMELNNGGVG